MPFKLQDPTLSKEQNQHRVIALILMITGLIGFSLTAIGNVANIIAAIVVSSLFIVAGYLILFQLKPDTATKMYNISAILCIIAGVVASAMLLIALFSIIFALSRPSLVRNTRWFNLVFATLMYGTEVTLAFFSAVKFCKAAGKCGGTVKVVDSPA